MTKQRFTIEHEVSAEFRRAARRFQMPPERLAQLLCDDFACRPPNELVIVSYSPRSVLVNQDGASEDEAQSESAK